MVIHLLLLTQTHTQCFGLVLTARLLTYHYFGQWKFHKQTMVGLYALAVIMSSAQFELNYLPLDEIK